MSEEQKTITNRDPKAGCIIMIVGAVIFTGLIIYTVSLPFKQSGLMGDFTQAEPAKVLGKDETKALESSFLERLQSVPQMVEEGQVSSELNLTKDEMNAAIYSYEEFEDLRGKMAVSKITPQEILFDISFPLRGRPFSEEIPYLNGIMHALPEVQDGEIVLNVTKIDSAKGAVPEGFLKHFQPYRIMAKYKSHEQIGRAMFSCEDISLGNETVTLQFNAKKYADPVAIKTESNDLKRKQKRTTMMTIFSFLLVGGLFFFLVKRRNKEAAKSYRGEG